MENMDLKLAKRAVATPLIGLVITWSLFMFATYSDLFIWDEYSPTGEYLGPSSLIKLSTYLVFLGISAGSLSALWGQILALKAREQLGDENRLGKAAHRFTNLTVIIGLVAGAIFAITNFLEAFNRFGNREDDLMVRLLGVYLPILLATALVVFVLLRAFVFRKTTIETEKTSEGLSEAQKALGLGYAVPIVATAVAIIFGLVVYDVTRTDLQVWVWVVIQVIIVVGILLGTRFASKAKSSKPAPPRARALLATGAANLNFVLSIIFGVAVTVMAFTFGSSAIQKLQVWQESIMDKEVYVPQPPTIEPVTFGWLLEDFLPALVLLLIGAIGIYSTIVERNKDKTS
jgi:hypothetical protein